ncbi:MAG: CDP-glycerol glycerophosphotransferase family protein [Aeromicrobium sp.]
MSDRLKDLLRRVIERARVSPNPVMRLGLNVAQDAFRFVGLILPGLGLGWMSALRSARWDGDDLVLRGWSLVRGSDHGGSPRHEVYLRRPRHPVWLGGRVARATVHHVADPDVMGGPSRSEVDYSGATWEARFPAAVLAGLPTGQWQLHAKVVRDLRRSWGPVRNAYMFGSPVTAVARQIGKYIVGSLVVRDGDGAFVFAAPLGIPALAVATDGREVRIEVSASDTERLGAGELRGRGQTPVPLTATPEGYRTVLRATLPAGKKFTDRLTGVRYPPRWTAVAESGEPITLLADDIAPRPLLPGDLVVRPTTRRELELVDVPHVVEVDSIARDGDELRMTGSIVGDPSGFSLVLAAPRSELPVTVDDVAADGTFTATAPLRVSAWGGPPLPPARGAYVLEGRLAGLSGENARFATFVSDGYAESVPIIEAGDDVRLRFEVNAQPQLLVRVTRPRAEDEYGAYNQRVLFEQYAKGETQPVDALYFESFFGRSATCNPRAIDAEIARRRPELPRYWSVDDASVAVPAGGIPLVIGTREWWRIRQSARWIVTNEWLRGRYVKKRFQTVLQTWHGSMYKRIGLDRAGGGQTGRARAERANWDMFISQNGDTTPIIQQAYEFQGADAGAVLEIGYPRNDDLTHIDPARVSRIREVVGIPDGDRVVLYAPTWREPGQQVELLNLISLAKEVGPGFTFLQRGHVRTLEEGERVGSKAVIDVSTYPQINDLFMAADLLITDYSSMMFDYSVTGRPMLFYTPDIEEYTDPKVRGAYFDLEELAPGPVVRTVPDVVKLLGTIDGWAPTFGDRYDAWRQRFNHLDDGHASARAVDALFAFDPTQHGDTQVRRHYDPAAGEEA